MEDEILEIQKGIEAKFDKQNEKFTQMQGELKKLQDEGATKAQLVKMTESIKEQGEILTELSEARKENSKKGFGVEFKSFLEENKGTIEGIYKSRAGEVTFTPKAVGDISTSSGSDVDTPDNTHANLSRIQLRDDSLMLRKCNVIRSSNKTYPYTEVSPKEGGYDFVPEGGAKPQIDFEWVTRYAEPKKIAAHMILTEESVTDFVRLESVAKGFLKDKHDLKKVDAVYFGTGVGEAVKGATVYGSTFAAGAMAGKVVNPNFMDTVNAVITNMYTTLNYVDEGNKMPNIVLVNPVDFFIHMVSAKDGNGLPLYPQAGLFNLVNIGKATIMPWVKVPSGKVFVADMKKYNISNYVPYSIRIGWINDQMITNKFTMVGESRFHAFVKNFDTGAFKYDDIATIKAAIKVV